MAVTRNILSIIVLRLSLFPPRFPFGKLPLALLAVIVGENVRQDTPRNLLNFVLRDVGVVNELLSSPQRHAPFLLKIKAQTRFAPQGVWCLHCILCDFILA